MTLLDDRPPRNTAAVLATRGGKKRLTPPVLQEGRPLEGGTGRSDGGAGWLRHALPRSGHGQFASWQTGLLANGTSRNPVGR